MSALMVFKAGPGSYYIHPEGFPTLPGTADMLAPLQTANDAASPAQQKRRGLGALLRAFVIRFPFLSLFGLIFLSNGMGSFFNIAYNHLLIAKRYMNDPQREVFTSTAIPLYNCVVYPLGISLTVYLLVPLVRCRRRL